MQARTRLEQENVMELLKKPAPTSSSLLSGRHRAGGAGLAQQTTSEEKQSHRPPALGQGPAGAPASSLGGAGEIWGLRWDLFELSSA